MRKTAAIVLFFCLIMTVFSGCSETELPEEWGEVALLHWSDSSDDWRIVIEDMRADAQGAAVAVTDREAGSTVLYRFRGDSPYRIAVMSWDYGEKPDPDKQWNDGLILYTDGSLISAGTEEGERCLRIYPEDSVTGDVARAFSFDGTEHSYDKLIGIPGFDSSGNCRIVPVDESRILLFSESGEANGWIVDIESGVCSESVFTLADMKNGAISQGVLYRITDRKLTAADVLTGEIPEGYKEISLRKALKDGEEPVTAGFVGEVLYWLGPDGSIHATDLPERKDRRVVTGSREFSADDGWKVIRAAAGESGTVYIQYERETEETRETVIAVRTAETSSRETSEIHLAGQNSQGVELNVNSEEIYFSKAVASSVQPAEFWADTGTYLKQWYMIRYYARFDDPVIRPRCSIEGCDHTTADCEAWYLNTQGGEIFLSESGNRYKMYCTQPSEFGWMSGLVIEKNGEVISEFPEFILPEGSIYSDGERLFFSAANEIGQKRWFVSVDAGTGETEKRLCMCPYYIVGLDEETGLFVFTDNVQRKSFCLDPQTWQVYPITEFDQERSLDVQVLRPDGCGCIAEPQNTKEEYSQLRIPEELGEDYQIFRESGSRALLLFHVGSRGTARIADLETGEITGEPVWMENVWGECSPIIYRETEDYYVIRPYCVSVPLLYPDPPGYADGIARGPYRQVYAFMSKEDFWNCSQEYTVFEVG